MVRRTIVMSALLVFLLVGCTASGPVCNEPYIRIGDTCCLDSSGSGICDRDEQEPNNSQEEFDCSMCPPTIITEEEVVEVIRYVCSDGETVVDNVAECAALMEPEIIFTPITTNEDDQEILEEFKLRPACRGNSQAVEFYFKVGTAANNFRIEAKTHPDEAFETIYEFSSPVYERYLYAGLCSIGCSGNTDFRMEPEKKYLVRGVLDLRDTSWDRIIYTNEHVIDHTSGGEYDRRLC